MKYERQALARRRDDTEASLRAACPHRKLVHIRSQLQADLVGMAAATPLRESSGARRREAAMPLPVAADAEGGTRTAAPATDTSPPSTGRISRRPGDERERTAARAGSARAGRHWGSGAEAVESSADGSDADTSDTESGRESPPVTPYRMTGQGSDSSRGAGTAARRESEQARAVGGGMRSVGPHGSPQLERTGARGRGGSLVEPAWVTRRRRDKRAHAPDPGSGGVGGEGGGSGDDGGEREKRKKRRSGSGGQHWRQRSKQRDKYAT